MLLTIPRIVLAGVSSGVGKTTITTAFITNLRARGIRVQPFKVGPDYIDPSHLAFATSQPCYNLDTWMMPPSRMLDIFCSTAASADIAVIEGVMGLYDGQSSTSDVGSTAEIATLLSAPVVLVIDAGAMARSAAAVVLGFQHLDPQVHIVGVIANRVGGVGHARLLQEAIEAETGSGFPEEYAHRLSANASMHSALVELLQKDIPCYAECGGLMYLCQSIRTASGEELPMVGALARQSIVSSDRSGLVIGYREATALRDTLLTLQREVVRGHEFHYSCLDAPFARNEVASTVSHVFHTLEAEYEQWKQRQLASHSTYAFADGTDFPVIYNGEGCKMPILAVGGIATTGERDGLAFRVGDRENEQARTRPLRRSQSTRGRRD